MLNNKERLTLDFPKGSKKEFEELRSLTLISTITALFRRAIDVYKFILQRQKEGWRFTMERAEGEKEVVRFF
jgi:hypothetical protein